MAPNLYLLEEDGISNFTFEESKSWPKGSCERFKNAIAWSKEFISCFDKSIWWLVNHEKLN